MRFVITPLPVGSHLVRVCEGDGPGYDRMIAVSEDGDCLHLQGWIGTPLTPAQWREGAAAHFPNAKRVRFERRKGAAIRHVELPLGSDTLP
jgi:hypothetical protein